MLSKLGVLSSSLVQKHKSCKSNDDKENGKEDAHQVFLGVEKGV
jgi:hypothetical protein